MRRRRKLPRRDISGRSVPSQLPHPPADAATGRRPSAAVPHQLSLSIPAPTYPPLPARRLTVRGIRRGPSSSSPVTVRSRPGHHSDTSSLQWPSAPHLPGSTRLVPSHEGGERSAAVVNAVDTVRPRLLPWAAPAVLLPTAGADGHSSCSPARGPTLPAAAVGGDSAPLGSFSRYHMQMV